ncbi:MAG TPA: hypothetical protein O0X50_04200 [Methanocorpusculum sp.]|nr:hypothetical protein [Methanocorpusculum sp.]
MIFLPSIHSDISAEKTAITVIEDGVDFIGWHLQLYNNSLELSPTKKYQEELLERLKMIIRQGTEHLMSNCGKCRFKNADK